MRTNTHRHNIKRDSLLCRESLGLRPGLELLLGVAKFACSRVLWNDELQLVMSPQYGDASRVASPVRS